MVLLSRKNQNDVNPLFQLFAGHERCDRPSAGRPARRPALCRGVRPPRHEGTRAGHERVGLSPRPPPLEGPVEIRRSRVIAACSAIIDLMSFETAS